MTKHILPLLSTSVIFPLQRRNINYHGYCRTLGGVAIIRGCKGIAQTTVTFESEKGFGKHILGSSQPTRRRKPSLNGRQTPCS
ncbi:Uncharacterised protein [Enterobacter hormaechei]|uniref:Uncharacterized protein n=1 Tax=Enterobacter hormaechei TaxID=158836 RepID=A0ABD7KV95_9ENTR|nr:Uncharacterised protein [Enterobacter hormaechei]SAE12804.1 Uncharacterised protein [Enterobacter hormaechei]SAG12457.1 Uncharacterised protein [Enterobacter hormaechei]VAE27940.1 Uncharacterised protein [Enterobacter hormaechei]VAE38316.1 Uncharacterised protein [Enterobacter hormaechei]